MRHNPSTNHRAAFEHRTLNERVLHRIRELILSGAIPSGAQLDEQSLADEMQISRTPIREAVSKLNKEGIVEYRPYKGNFVRSFTAKQVSDLFEVRKALEGLATHLAVAKLTDEYLALLKRTLQAVDVALERGNMAEYSAADREFHHMIAHMSDNESLIELLDRLEIQIQLVRTIANRDPDVVDRTAHERPQILAALEMRDAELAGQLMEEHIEGVRQAVVAQLQEHERQSVPQALRSKQPLTQPLPARSDAST